MVGQISGCRGRGGRRSNLVVMVLMVELLLQHQVMMVLRHVRRRRGRTVRVTGVVRESERAEGAVGVVVPLGQRGRPRTPRGVPGSCPAAGSRRRYEEDLSGERVFGQLITHRDGVVPGRWRTGAGRKIPGRQLLVVG